MVWEKITGERKQNPKKNARVSSVEFSIGDSHGKFVEDLWRLKVWLEDCVYVSYWECVIQWDCYSFCVDIVARRLVKTGNPSACAMVNWNVGKSAIVLYCLYLNVIKRECNQRANKSNHPTSFRHVYHPTRDNIIITSYIYFNMLVVACYIYCTLWGRQGTVHGKPMTVLNITK
jgi:hypothetical protein